MTTNLSNAKTLTVEARIKGATVPGVFQANRVHYVPAHQTDDGRVRLFVETNKRRGVIDAAGNPGIIRDGIELDYEQLESLTITSRQGTVTTLDDLKRVYG